MARYENIKCNDNTQRILTPYEEDSSARYGYRIIDDKEYDCDISNSGNKHASPTFHKIFENGPLIANRRWNTQFSLGPIDKSSTSLCYPITGPVIKTVNRSDSDSPIIHSRFGDLSFNSDPAEECGSTWNKFYD